MLVLALIVGLVLGASVVGVLAVVVLNGQSAGGPRPYLTSAARALLRRAHPQDTATSRDYAEHAGGSRHIRTHPSWRDRLE
ncbi:hypothetical protein [Nocardia terpenica]|uniref:hypothetical protein n=1 Tax=Nocardia terpenica TaxID=455432 RepID=UPI0003127489|nr:hypothetical protein [Nocardia terpenica]NQE90895.1 hypothetical protein [Nocardia terpenica]